ncbi:helix-turn-helix transcriptional regulator [Pilimelia columellifera]|uniref:Helix-turn-helix transcriptional regulator n=1 Tax=Pilimelia columellifera subsp. columellifera TaxID=706583 RepID=A0ABN3N6J5_9ACTN
MSRVASPVIRRRRLGVELRRLRESSGLTGDQVVEMIGWASSSKVSRIENGRSRADLGDVLDLLDLYGATDEQREQLVAIARDAGNSRGWLRAYPAMTPQQRTYAELEVGCSMIREYAQQILPGLLQTPGYARCRILGSGDSRTDDLDSEVAARTARTHLLRPENDPPRYEAILEETAFTGRVAPPDVIASQLQHLHQLTEMPHVTLRVLPPDAVIGEWYIPATSFSVYQFTDPDDPGTVAVEALARDHVLSDGSSLEEYLRAFSWLREAARGPEETRDWLADAAAAIRSRQPAPTTDSSSRRDDDHAGPPAIPPAQRGPVTAHAAPCG